MPERLRPLFAICLAGIVLGACAAPSPEAIKADFQAGLADYDAGNYAAAYQKWLAIADDDLAAMRNVALMLRKGQGVAKDPKAAQNMMARAADGGLATAQADLADMLLNGEAGPPDVEAAIPWLKLAAEAGHPIAAFQLGQLYEQGNGVERNLEAARKLYKTAATSGMAEAAERLKNLPPEPVRTAVPQNPPPAPGH